MVAIVNITLQLVFDEFFKVVVAETIQTVRYKPFYTLLKRLHNTLITIQPVFYENRLLIKALDRPQKENVMFISFLNKAKKLVLKSSRICFRNNYQKVIHAYKLVRLNNELVRLFQNEMQVKMASDMMIPMEIDDLEDKVDKMLPTFISHEELRLDITSRNYSIPESINRMGQLKVLSIISKCDHPSKLHNLSLISSLPNLTTIRFEHVSISSIRPIFALRNLKQLSFVMCEIGNAFMSFTTESSYNMLPNLTHLEIDMCYDLKQLPSWVYNLVNLQKLSITNCHELENLPKGLGGLSNLESLSLRCCTKLRELPNSIGSLRNLRFIDISDCLSVSDLPEEFGELCALRVLKMSGCTGLQELPVSTSELSCLEEVICDEETSYLWMDFETDLHNLKINVVEDDRVETFMKIVQ